MIPLLEITRDYKPKNWGCYVIVNEQPAIEGLERKRAKQFYTGISNNIRKRLWDHNNGRCKATRGRAWKLVASITGLTQGEASELERWLKRGETRYKRSFVFNYSLETAEQKEDVEHLYRRLRLYSDYADRRRREDRERRRNATKPQRPEAQQS